MRLLSWSILPVITISRPWIWTSASWARVVLITLCWRRFMTSLTVWRIVWVILSGKQLIEKMCRKRVEVAYAEKSGEECDGGIIWIWFLKSSNLFLKSSRPSLLIKRAALGNLKASFHCTHWHCFFPLKKAFSKITPSLFTIKEGSTSHPDPLTLRGEGGNRSSSSLGTASL